MYIPLTIPSSVKEIGYKKFSAKKPAVKIAKVPASSKYRIHNFIMAKLCTQNGHQHTKLKLRSNFTWHKHLNYF